MENGRTAGAGKRIFWLKPVDVGIFCRSASAFFLLFLMFACSTAPERPVEVRSLRKLGESQLELANQEMDRSNFDAALIMLEDTWRVAVSSDDPSLRIRTALSLGNAHFSLGQKEEAYAVWKNALQEAEDIRELRAVCVVYIARADLLSAREAAAAGDAADVKNTAQRVRTEVVEVIGFIKDRLYTAFAWTVIAMADKELGYYAEAEAFARRALSIREKARYLEQAAFNWYLIASIRSVAGDYAGAVQALFQAIGFDRRAENTYGLGADWRALGDVYKKAGQADASEAAYRRSADIFRALRMESETAAEGDAGPPP